jgi:hypothetical protein
MVKILMREAKKEGLDQAQKLAQREPLGEHQTSRAVDDEG